MYGGGERGWGVVAVPALTPRVFVLLSPQPKRRSARLSAVSRGARWEAAPAGARGGPAAAGGRALTRCCLLRNPLLPKQSRNPKSWRQR